jgi:hypothetical protein
MDQARMDKAMTRIEAALARIEAAGVSRARERSTDGQDETLRATVDDALRKLDDLIAELGS